METMETKADVAFELLLEIQLQMEDFATSWSHCDLCSTYVASMVSHDRHDPIRHANLLSAALNELFEMSFHAQYGTGTLNCRFCRSASSERVDLTFACSSEQRDIYEAIVGNLGNGENLPNYLHALTDDAARVEDAILLGLVVNYEADIELWEREPGTLTFVVDLALERLLN